jgi:hypothetical protein
MDVVVASPAEGDPDPDGQGCGQSPGEGVAKTSSISMSTPIVSKPITMAVKYRNKRVPAANPVVYSVCVAARVRWIASPMKSAITKPRMITTRPATNAGR